MGKTKKSLKELGDVVTIYPQVLKNLNVSKKGKDTWQNNVKIQNIIKESETKLNGEGRILVRASGTENLIRVMLEGKDIAFITKICDEIIDVMAKELN